MKINVLIPVLLLLFIREGSNTLNFNQPMVLNMQLSKLVPVSPINPTIPINLLNAVTSALVILQVGTENKGLAYTIMYNYVSLSTYEQNEDILKVSRIGSSNTQLLFGLLEVMTADFIFLTVNPQNITGSVTLVFQTKSALLPVDINSQFNANITATAAILPVPSEQ